ncbi:hypothetical protein FRC03_001928 [Tulasnella sp. 419]|nr:hypothetical protein FRC03_001928 [Tulasnella sp. 419]
MLLVKLTHNGITRKASFPSRPTWDALAVKIETLFAIPASQVGVTYTDPDGDLITISSQDELWDYLAIAGNNAKFQVKRLSASAGVAQVIPPVSVTSEDHLPTPIHGSPDTIVLQAEDWDANIPLRRDNDTPLGSMPILEDISVFPGLSSMRFGFMPGATILRDDDSMSSARIEEIPSSTNSKAHSIASGVHSPRDPDPRSGRYSARNSRYEEDRSQTFKKDKGKAKSRNSFSPPDSFQTAYSEAPKSGRIEVTSPSSAAETARPRIFIPDPDDLPLPHRPAPLTSSTTTSPPNIYADVAAVMDALTKIMVRTADGTYKNQYMDRAVEFAGDAAARAAQVAVEEATKKVRETMDTVVQTLSEIGSPTNATFPSSTPSVARGPTHIRAPSNGLRRTPSYRVASNVPTAPRVPSPSPSPSPPRVIKPISQPQLKTPAPKTPAPVTPIIEPPRSPSPASSISVSPPHPTRSLYYKAEEPIPPSSQSRPTGSLLYKSDYNVEEPIPPPPQPRPPKDKSVPPSAKARPWTLHEARDTDNIPPFSPFGPLANHQQQPPQPPQPPHPFSSQHPPSANPYAAGPSPFLPPFGPSPYPHATPLDPAYGHLPQEHNLRGVPPHPFYHPQYPGYGPPPGQFPPGHPMHQPHPVTPAPAHHHHDQDHEENPDRTVERQQHLMDKAKRQAERAQLRAQKETEKEEQRKERVDRKKRYDKG